MPAGMQSGRTAKFFPLSSVDRARVKTTHHKVIWSDPPSSLIDWLSEILCMIGAMKDSDNGQLIE